MTPENQKRKYQYLQKNIFNGLTDYNNGFDSPVISHFSMQQFEIVLARVKEKKVVGVYRIEVFTWNSDSNSYEFWEVDTFENYRSHPQDSEWYYAAFEKFKEVGREFLYSA